MNTIDNIKERFHSVQASGNGKLRLHEQNAFETFNRLGVPTSRHEEWKYTRIGNIFNKEFRLKSASSTLTIQDVEAARMPGYEDANEMVFVNGIYAPSLSTIKSSEIVIQSLQ